MSYIIEITAILFLSIFQSIFGIGLLLFGTPFFLYLDYSFPNTLSLLLPTSITISLFQFIFSKNLDYKFVFDFNLYCIPTLIIFLIITFYFDELINFKFLVSVLLIFSSLLILYKKYFFKFLKKFFLYRKFLLAIIGFIHGVSNMGGSFLSIFSSSLSYDNKILTRQYISYGYLSMGIIQYIILLIFNYSYLSLSKFFYVIIALIVYFPSQIIFNYIIYDNYVKIIGFIALFFGLFIIFSFFY